MQHAFVGVRPTSWAIITLAIVGYALTTLLINAVLFQGAISDRLGSLYRATGFFIHSALIGGILSLAVIGIILCGFGRLRPADMGWRAAPLGIGLIVTFGFWVAMNGVVALVAALHGEVDANDDWSRFGAAAVVGALIGQLCGNALAEEVLFRGFLVPQLFFKAATRLRAAAAMATAVVGSSALFALSHLPNRLLVRDFTTTDVLLDQGGTFLFGLIMTAAFLVTRNLFVAVGLHSLVNAPTLLVRASSPEVPYAAWAGLVAVLLIGWQMASLHRHRGRRPALP